MLQVLSGLLAGLFLLQALRPRCGPRLALGAALVLWLHPTLIGYRLTFLPVSFALLLTSAMAWSALRLLEAPDDRRRQWSLGLSLAPLPFVAPQALALLPSLQVWPGPRRARRVLGPVLVAWLPWMVLLSVLPQAPTAVGLAGPRTVEMGNSRYIDEDRGSLWDDPVADAWIDSTAAGYYKSVYGPSWRGDWYYQGASEPLLAAWEVVVDDPAAAARRAWLRLLETWVPDRLIRRRVAASGGSTTVAGGLGFLVLHAALLTLAMFGLRTREGRIAWTGIALWCLPILLTIGHTEIRQPLVPWLLVAAAFGLGRVRPPT